MKAINIRFFAPAAAVLLAGLLSMAIAGNAIQTGVVPWEILCISMLFFTVYDAISGVFSDKWVLTTVIGYGLFALMMTVLYMVADAVSPIEMRDLPQFQKFLVLIVTFKVLLTGLAGLYRFFINLLNS